MSRKTQRLPRWVAWAAVLLFAVGLPWSARAGGFGTPSNLGGLWKLTITPGVHLISFPLLSDYATPSNVLGSGFPGGTEWDEATRLVTIEDGEYVGVYFDSNTGQWEGNLTILEPRRGYWLIVPDGAAQVHLTLAGQSLEADTVRMNALESGWNLVAAPRPYPVTLEASGLAAAGLVRNTWAPLADRVYTLRDNSLVPAWMQTGGDWAGASFVLAPGSGYLVWHAPGHGALTWTVPRPAGMEGWGEGPSPLETAPLPDALRRIAPPLPDFSTPPWEGDTVPVKRSPRGGER